MEKIDVSITLSKAASKRCAEAAGVDFNAWVAGDSGDKKFQSWARRALVENAKSTPEKKTTKNKKRKPN